MCENRGGVGASRGLSRLAQLVQANPNRVPSRSEIQQQASSAGPSHISDLHLVDTQNGLRVEIRSQGRGGHTISSLSSVLGISVTQVWQVVTRNNQALRATWTYVYEDEHWPGTSAARRRLTNEGNTPLLTGNATQVQSVFEHWPVPISTNPPLQFPVSERFLTRARDHRLTLRARSASPSARIVLELAEHLENDAQQLKDYIELYQTFIAKDLGNVSSMLSLESMLNALDRHPKNGHDDLNELRQLRTRLIAFRTRYAQEMVANPPHIAGTVRSGATTIANMLRTRLNNAANIQHLENFLRNRPLVSNGAAIHRRIERAVSGAMGALSRSSIAGQILQESVLPLLATLDGEAPSGPQNLLSILTLAPSAVGNVAGPSSLWIAVSTVYGPVLAKHFGTNYAASAAMSARLFRLCGITQAHINTINNQLSAGNTAGANRTITQNMQAGRVGTSIMAVINLAILLYVSTGSQRDSFAYWGNVVASMFGSAAAIQSAMASFRVLDATSRAGIIASGVGTAAGVAASIVAVGLNLYAMRSAIEADDIVGAMVAGSGAFGAALSSVGFILAAASETSIVAGLIGTAAAASVGAILMAIGAAVGIVAGIVGVVISVTTEGSQSTFNAYWRHIGRAGGPLYGSQGQRAGLWQEYQSILSDYDDFDWWDVHPNYCKELESVGFSPAYLALIVNEEEDEVNRRLAL